MVRKDNAHVSYEIVTGPAAGTWQAAAKAPAMAHEVRRLSSSMYAAVRTALLRDEEGRQVAARLTELGVVAAIARLPR